MLYSLYLTALKRADLPPRSKYCKYESYQLIFIKSCWIKFCKKEWIYVGSNCGSDYTEKFDETNKQQLFGANFSLLYVETAAAASPSTQHLVESSICLSNTVIEHKVHKLAIDISFKKQWKREREKAHK